ncbi:MAG: bifunctional proline dehydrogenase/L-glutamate gamma-semialdehyde dehydrogenase PutA, partial [Gammaproteobacteria bacterium]
HTVTAVLAMAEKFGVATRDFEFQRLYGMGETLHEQTRREHGTRHRIYGPVGDHQDLLAYLVRRMLENGANNSFVHQLTDHRVPVQAIAADPVALLQNNPGKLNIPEPHAIFGKRQNSAGFDLANPDQLQQIERLRDPWRVHQWQATPLLAGRFSRTTSREVCNPAAPQEVVGTVMDCSVDDIPRAFSAAQEFHDQWRSTAASERAACLYRAADLDQQNFGELCALMMRETGKVLADVVSEWREAVDFLRYYGQQAQELLPGKPRISRGVFACIAPWNFPLSIFTGQLAAALAGGNTVLAKPAEQASLVAFRAVQLLHRAGVPVQALQFLPGAGETVGAALSSLPRLGGVCFTGSHEVARRIRRAMAAATPQARLIAETGGINAMIVDSTALPEQTVGDILSSAFSRAGQRCSALRVVYFQEEIADDFIKMLIGAMDTLVVGDPWDLSTDIGPVIDNDARQEILHYQETNSPLHQLPVPQRGLFVAPALLQVRGITDITREIFGPVLHIARFRSDELEQVVDDINAAGYGLTCAIHSRLTGRVNHCIERLQIGNIYVNRDQVGAVVESQPFGGRGLSGTGPKAGGPLYLPAFTRDPAMPASIDQPDLAELDGAVLQAQIDRLLAQATGDPELVKLAQLFAESAALAACSMPRSRIMPGPTGERNVYQLRGIAVCLCLGPGAAQALEQALQALAFGGAAILCCDLPQWLSAKITALRQSGFRVLACEGTPAVAVLRHLQGIAAVSYCGDEAHSRELLASLGERDGPLIRFISEPISPGDYCFECHVCNDITSAGGNMELMAMGEEQPT